MNHSEDIFNKSLQDLEMTEKQGNKYQILCEKIGVSIYNLLKVVNQTHDNVINLKDKL